MEIESIIGIVINILNIIMKSITREMYIVKPNRSYLIEHLLLDLECKPKRLASHKLYVYTLNKYPFMAITERYSTKLLRI